MRRCWVMTIWSFSHSGRRTDTGYRTRDVILYSVQCCYAVHWTDKNCISSNSLMSILCLSVCRLCVPNIMTLGICLKKLHLIKVVAFCCFAWYNVKIRAIFGVRFESWKADKKKQTYMKTEAYKLYSRVFWIFLPNVIKIDSYSFELYRFKVGAFFETVLSAECLWCRSARHSTGKA